MKSSSSTKKAKSSSSSSKEKTINALLQTKGEQFNASFTYGTMKDPRDGKTYKTTELNGQTWMAENLNYAGNKVGKSFCYGNDEDICEIYGRLYSREGAMNSDTCGYNQACSLGDSVQGACSDGWHIPSLSEAEDLNVLSYSSLASMTGWRVIGEDSYGLSFLPTGNKRGDKFSNIGLSAFMWVNTLGAKQRYFVVNGNDERVLIHQGINDTALYLSIRCVKDN